MLDVTGRHPGTQHFANLFEHDHLRDDLQPIVKNCAALAQAMIFECEDGPELTTGLRKLLEAKDCFVRAALG